MVGRSWKGKDRRVGPNLKQLNAVGGTWAPQRRLDEINAPAVRLTLSGTRAARPSSIGPSRPIKCHLFDGVLAKWKFFDVRRRSTLNPILSPAMP